MKGPQHASGQLREALIDNGLMYVFGNIALLCGFSYSSVTAIPLNALVAAICLNLGLGTLLLSVRLRVRDCHSVHDLRDVIFGVLLVAALLALVAVHYMH